MDAALKRKDIKTLTESQLAAFEEMGFCYANDRL